MRHCPGHHLGVANLQHAWYEYPLHVCTQQLREGISSTAADRSESSAAH